MVSDSRARLITYLSRAGLSTARANAVVDNYAHELAEKGNTRKLEEVAREELRLLWKDLNAARGVAINGEWSMQCDHLVHRIKELTTLLGPTPWDEISIELLEAGIYQRVHGELDMEPPVDMERVAKVRARSGL